MTSQQWSGQPATSPSGKHLNNPLPDNTPLGEARRQLRKNSEKGWHCPCCQQFVKVYRRKIYGAMVASLVTLFMSGGRSQWVHFGSVNGYGGDYAKLVHWGLIEEDQTRTGYWRVTKLGEDWITGKTTVPMYVKLYDGIKLGLEGNQVTVQEALGKKFDLQELMQGV